MFSYILTLSFADTELCADSLVLGTFTSARTFGFAATPHSKIGRHRVLKLLWQKKPAFVHPDMDHRQNLTIMRCSVLSQTRISSDDLE